MKSFFILVACFSAAIILHAQPGSNFKWSDEGNAIIEIRPEGNIVKKELATGKETILINADQLKAQGTTIAIKPSNYSFNSDQTKWLLFTNTSKVWRYHTRGDYWLLDKTNNQLRQLGKDRPSQSLMFAKLSPDGTKVGYVSEKNIYVEDIATGVTRQLTIDGTRKLINGTFDWVYEEEFFCKDGFRWSADSKWIAYWQVDANDTRDFYMINNTDSVYSQLIPVEYPKAGEPPSSVRIGVVDVTDGKTTWMKIPGDPRQHYLTRVEWAANATELIVQQLNRGQNESKLWICNVSNGESNLIFSETENAWIDIVASWDQDYVDGGWDWLNNGKEFLWPSEKDGWRHLYKISRDGKKETLVTIGDFDVMDIAGVDDKGGYVYYFASPGNATQKYLYRSKLDGKVKPERLSPPNQQGTHNYKVSPNTKFSRHVFSNHYTQPSSEWVSLPSHKGLNGENKVNETVAKARKESENLEFFKIKTADGVEMDAWMVKPENFDPAKKYPVVFYVYTEPWGQEVKDQFGVADNQLYIGDMAADGYFYIAIDNRGTPVPKGRAWRKSVYRKIGILNIHDQAMAAKEILKWSYIDTSRVAVWGWSGGGTATLNLMFQYPDLYKTGISVAAVGNMFTYDNIYQERYMGLPQENREDFIKGSPITYAKNLQGNLLYIHGTGDDNVHYQNAEMLLNELIKYNKQFQFMPYPNRTHSINEGAGTTKHLQTLYTQYLRKYCPPGGR